MLSCSERVDTWQATKRHVDMISRSQQDHSSSPRKHSPDAEAIRPMTRIYGTGHDTNSETVGRGPDDGEEKDDDGEEDE